LRVDTPGFWRRWGKRVRAPAHWFGFVAFYALLANIPYLFVAHEFGFRDLGWFCVQYATIGLIALFVPRLFAAILLLLIIFADLLCGICLSFSLPIRQSLEEIGAAHAFSGKRLICVGIAILLVATAAAVSVSLPGSALSKDQRFRAASCLIAFVIIVVSSHVVWIYLATGNVPRSLRPRNGGDGVDVRTRYATRIARIPVVRLLGLETAELRVFDAGRHDAMSPAAIPSATQVAIGRAGIMQGENSDPPDLVQIVVESWGRAEDAPLREALVRFYLQPGVRARYEVIQGSVPFNGSTIPGEARELCGASLGFHLLDAAPPELTGCLPARLAELGYGNIALHGMDGNLFGRTHWYRTIGFQEAWFHNQFQARGLPDCDGALIGTCDADIASWISRRLDENHPRPYFIHWMTLNSHLPVLVPSQVPNGAPCNAPLSLQPNTPLCSWYQLIANVHRSVAAIATSELARPTIFVIVGDHAPPFGSPVLFNRFSHSDVPYVILLPREKNLLPRTMLARNITSPRRGEARATRRTP
jgi:hypothetical protein